MWKTGYVLASRYPLLHQAVELETEVQKALGLSFRLDKWKQVVAHLCQLIALWRKYKLEKLALPNNFDRSVKLRV